MPMSSRSISLFSESGPMRTRPSRFAFSALLHGVACGVVLYGLSRSPRVEDPALVRHYSVRLLDLHQAEPQPRLSMPGALSAAAADTEAAKGAPGDAGAAAAPSAPPQRVQMNLQTQTAPQTLVQPDLPKTLVLLHPIPLPTVVMWSLENSTARVILAPPPQPLTAAQVHPPLEIPNREVTLAEVKIASSDLPTEAPSLPPSTTTPVAVRGPQAVQPVSLAAAKPTAWPTPVRVVSLSDLEMPEGTVALPMANQTAAATAAGFALGPTAGAAGDGTRRAERASGTDGRAVGRASDGAGSGHERVSSAGDAVARSGVASGTGNGAASSGDSPPDGGSEPAVTRIKQRKDGKFGVVVVGSSIEDAYPEAAGVWSGRLAYTVYLHVGLAKSWILQYSLPRNAAASVAGTVTRPDAPWPYDMVRPHLPPGDGNADAILVHGVVNAAGKFEQLGIVFPLEFAQARFLLSALEQWQFRPAMANGEAAPVEVLLIIPEESE